MVSNFIFSLKNMLLYLLDINGKEHHLGAEPCGASVAGGVCRLGAPRGALLRAARWPAGSRGAARRGPGACGAPAGWEQEGGASGASWASREQRRAARRGTAARRGPAAPAGRARMGGGATGPSAQ